MAYDFPANPVVGQEYTPPMGGQTYIWFPPRWLVKGVPPAVEGGGLGIEEAPINSNQYGRQNGTWTQITSSLTWTTLPGKPATFPPDPHAHPQTDIIGLAAALSAKETFITMGTTSQFWRGDKTWQSIPVQDWTTLTGKPSTFTPSAHSHPQSEVTNLVTDLAGKAPVSHTHTQAEVTGLVAGLAAKEPTVIAGTTSQFWRGDKTWQSVPAGDWNGITNKPATFPPSTHAHAMTDITGLQAALDAKSVVGHTHDYATLANIPNTFAPAAHVHAQADITGLVTALAAKAPLASPVFTGTVTLPIVNATGAMTGVTGDFSGSLEAGGTITSKATTGNCYFWLRGPANEDRMVLYTTGPALGNTILRVGGTQSFQFSQTGIFIAPVGVSSGTGAFTGAITGSTTISAGTTITAGGNISNTNGHIIANDYVYSTAGYFIGNTLAILGTASGVVGDVYLRPYGYNSATNQTYVDGATGNLYAQNYILSNAGRFYGNSTSVTLTTNGSQGTIHLRPNGGGSAVGETTIDFAGTVETYTNAIINGNIYFEQDLVSLSASVVIGGTGNGSIYLRPVDSTSTEQAYYTSGGNFYIGNSAYKAVAGGWGATSDARIKNVVGDYEIGLKEIRQLKVRRYTYKGNETMLAEPAPLVKTEGKKRTSLPNRYEDSPHYRQALAREEFISLIAQEAELVMPDLVTQQEAWIDGKPVTDLRVLDPTNVTWALLNAVKELAARVETLEEESHGHATGTH